MADPITGLVRRKNVPDYGEGTTGQLAINGRGEALVSQALLSKAGLVVQGNSWSVMTATGSAFTNVANMPTTLAVLALYNGEPGTGKSYVIDQIGFLCLTSITAASGLTLIYQMGAPAALTDDTAQLINSPVGATYNGRAKRAINVTTMIANKWTPLASNGGAGAAVSIGTGCVANVDGGIIVPPGYTLGVNAVLGTATGTSLMSISWHEVQLPV